MIDLLVRLVSSPTARLANAPRPVLPAVLAAGVLALGGGAAAADLAPAGRTANEARIAAAVAAAPVRPGGSAACHCSTPAGGPCRGEPGMASAVPGRPAR